jgi:hypothetical protein
LCVVNLRSSRGIDNLHHNLQRPASGCSGIGCMILAILYSQGARTMENSQRPETLRQRFAPIKMPGFLFDEDVGLGDAVKRATYALGITPCQACEGRANALNRLVVFSGKKKPSF